MTKNILSSQQRNRADTPAQPLPRFVGQATQASSGKSAAPLQPISFRSTNSYLEQMNSIADLGEGIFNATLRVKEVSDRAEQSQRDAYLANVEVDDIVQTNRIANENELNGNDPEALASALGSYRDGKRDAMPADIQPYYEQSFNKRAAVLTVKAQDAFYNKAQSDAKNSLQNAQKLIRDDIFTNPAPATEIEVSAYQDKIGKYRATLQSRVDHGFITAEEAQIEQKGFQKDLITTSYKTQIQSMGPNARAKTIYALEQSKTLPAGLNINDKEDIVKELNAFSSTIESTKTQAFAQENAAAALSKARNIADLDLRASRGEATYEEIQQAEAKRLITPEKKTSLFKTLDNNTEKKVKDSELIQKVARTLDGKDYIDPKNTDDKKAVDLAYTTAVEPQAKAMQDTAAQKSLVTNFIAATGVVPATLQGKIRGVFRGANVNDKVYYADLVGRIQETKPQALDDFDDKDVTQAMMIDQLIKAGTPNEEAVKRVEDITNNISPGRIESLKAEYDAKKKDTTRDQALTNIADIFDTGIFSGNANLPNRQLGVETSALNDYDKIYKTWFLNTNGDADIAKQQADRTFKNSWGTTSVNGVEKQLTKYPIEKAYPKLDSTEIKNSLVTELKGLPEYKDIAGEDVFLQYDKDTAREWGSNPKYKVLIRNKDGVIEPVLDRSKSRWGPDYNKIVNDKRVSAQMDAQTTRNTTINTNEFKQEQKDLAARERVKNAGKKIMSGAKDLGDKIFRVFISDAGAAEPTPTDLQFFGAKENLTEDQLHKTMVAQNKVFPDSYNKTELKVIPAVIKQRYYQSSPADGSISKPMDANQISANEVRKIMREQMRVNPSIGYTEKEIQDLPPEIVNRFLSSKKIYDPLTDVRSMMQDQMKMNPGLYTAEEMRNPPKEIVNRMLPGRMK